MINRSIVSKLWFYMAILMVIVLSILGYVLGNMFENFYYNLEANNLITKGAYLGSVFKNEGEQQAEVAANVLAEQTKATIVIADPSGLVRSCNFGGHMGRMKQGMRLAPDEVKKVQAGELLIRRGAHPHFEVEMLSVVVPVKMGNKVEQAVLLYAPLQPFTETAAELKRLIFLSALIAIFLVTILTFFLSKKVSKPLLSINSVAAKMIDGDFDQQVQVETADEIGLLGQTLNMLSRKLKETLQTLSQQKNQLSNVLTSMTDGVISIDADGYVNMVNPQARKLLGKDYDVTFGEHLTSYCPHPQIQEMFSQVNKGQLEKQHEITVDNKMLSVHMAPLAKSEENTGAVAVIRDITSEYRLEQMRKEFVANVSHELRTPLFLLQGYGQALQEGIGGEEAVEVIVDETRRMQRLVDDLLELTRLEAEVISLNKETILVKEFLLSSKKKFDAVAQEKEIILQCNVDETLSLVGDIDRLTQVMVNFLNNAIRHTPRGGEITLGAEKCGETIKITVSDTGQGISPEELESVWERFYRVDKARAREEGGTGLGLAIVKRIIEAHEGKVFAISELGKGSTFGFVIPM